MKYISPKIVEVNKQSIECKINLELEEEKEKLEARLKEINSLL